MKTESGSWRETSYWDSMKQRQVWVVSTEDGVMGVYGSASLAEEAVDADIAGFNAANKYKIDRDSYGVSPVTYFQR